MNDLDDGVKGEINNSNDQTPSEITSPDMPITAIEITPKVLTEQPKMEDQLKDNDDIKEKKETPSTGKESKNSLRLLGEPLVAHGPYTFYRSLAYLKCDLSNKKRRRWKKRQSRGVDDQSTKAESYDSSSSCCCGGNAGTNLCSCDDEDDNSCFSSSSSRTEWSVVRMNHFYAVRPWYSKINSCIGDRQHMQQRRRRKHSPESLTTSAVAASERRQHYQQSVCIGELELLWRDDSVPLTTTLTTQPSTSSSMIAPKKRNRVVSSNGLDAAVTSSSNSQVGAAGSSDDDDVPVGGENGDDSTSGLPPRRKLPRRTRQPSAKKLEATESAAAVAASEKLLSQQSYRRNQFSVAALSDSISAVDPTIGTHYNHGNILCSVRLYVMPDQTASGRLSGVHGDDEVLEINTFGANSSVDRWPNNININSGNGIGSIYGGADDYGYGSGSHSSGTLPSGCSGLVLRAEDFIEWIRGGLMNDDNDNEDTESDEASESEFENDRKRLKQEDEVQPTLLQSKSNIKSEIQECKTEKVKTIEDDKNNKVKLESTIVCDVVKKETQQLVSVNTDVLKKEDCSLLPMSTTLVKVKMEQEQDKRVDGDKEKIDDSDKSYCSKSIVDEAVEAERIPLAAAKIKKHNRQHIRRHHCLQQHRLLNCESLVNGSNVDRNTQSNELTTAVGKLNNDQKCDCYCCTRRHNYQCNNKKTKSYVTDDDSNKQQLVVMSYSRYCRYRAQLQRMREELLFKEDTEVVKVYNKDNTATNNTQGIETMSATRVLFCRDTYDYPAELLLQPFNVQQNQKQSTSVLVNYMAPKLKGWPSYPASSLSFRWNRVRRRLRHLEREGSGSNEDQRRRRRRRKLKKKCRQRQNGVSRTTVSIGYSSSTEDEDSNSDEASSATNDAATNTTTTASTSDSDCDPSTPSIVTKTVNKNNSAATSKVNGGVHHSKKNISVSSSNMIIINGANTVSVTAVNKRPVADIGQSSQQQNPKKRRYFVFPVEGQSQHQNQRIAYQQQQQHHHHLRPKQPHHMLVLQKQQQKQQSFYKQLPKPLALLQSSTKVIHHHLPPSVTIMPVMVPSTNTNAQQQKQRLNKPLPNRPKQLNVAAVLNAAAQWQKINDSQQTSVPPVIIEYDNDDNHERASDNSRHKKSTVASAIAACQKHEHGQDVEDEQRQQRVEEEKQRRWLVDALRLGGLEVTAVPLNVGASSGNNSGGSNVKNISVPSTATLQQQQRRQQFRQRGVLFEALPANNERHNGSITIQNERRSSSDINSNSDSVMMTVTPDVISLLNKSQQQKSPISTVLAPQQQQRRRSINLNNDSISSQQSHLNATNPATVAVLHDKINRAIDSLKQQQNSNSAAVPISKSSNIIVMGGSNYHQLPTNIDNNINNKQQQRQRKMSVYYQQSNDAGSQRNPVVVPNPQSQKMGGSLLDLTKRSIRHQKHSSPSPTTHSSNMQQQLLKNLLPFQSTGLGSSTAATNLEITILPVATSTITNASMSTTQQQQKRSSVTVRNNLISGTKQLSMTSSSSPLTVRQQLQQRNAAVAASTAPAASIMDILCNSGSQQLQQRNSSGISVTATTSMQQQQQQHQLLLMAAHAMAASSIQQEENNKQKPQQNRKD